MKFWVGVVSYQHVQIGKNEGFAQFCHGKLAPVKKLNPSDWILYYSSRLDIHSKIPYQKFTAIGQVVDSQPFQVEQFPGFNPYRRKINYIPNAQEVDIKPLINDLSFIKDKKKWGLPFRFGFLEIPQKDFELIAMKMLETHPHAIKNLFPHK